MNSISTYVRSFSFSGMLHAALAWFLAQPWWVEIVVVGAALYVVILIAVGIVRAILLIIDQLMRWALQFIHWLSSMVSRGVIAALQALGRGVMFLLRLLLWPVFWVWWKIKAAISGAVRNVQERLDEEQELRQLWEREFRDQFSTFKAFKESFNQGSGSGPREREEPHFGNQKFESPPNPPDPFLEACKRLGLPDTGEFSEKDLERKYRKFIKAVHPDNDGSDDLAALVNKARDIIKQRKGWA